MKCPRINKVRCFFSKKVIGPKYPVISNLHQNVLAFKITGPLCLLEVILRLRSFVNFLIYIILNSLILLLCMKLLDYRIAGTNILLLFHIAKKNKTDTYVL